MKSFTRTLKQRVLINCVTVCLLAFMFHVDAFAQDELQQGIQLFNLGKYADAKKVFESFAEKSQSNDQAAYYLGRSYFAENDNENAIKWLKKSTELNDGNSDYFFELGRAYMERIQEINMFKKMFMARKIKGAFERSIELDPENIKALYALGSFYAMAPSIAGGSKDKAKELAARLMKLDAAMGHNAYGAMYAAEKNTEAAIREYKTAISIDPDNKESYLGFGNTYIELEDYDKAFDLYENLVQEKSGMVFAYYQIGKLSAISGLRFDSGEKALKHYMKQDLPEGSVPVAWAHYRLGMIYDQKGDKKSAASEYKTALKEDPDFKEAKKALKKLNQKN